MLILKQISGCSVAESSNPASAGSSTCGSKSQVPFGIRKMWKNYSFSGRCAYLKDGRCSCKTLFESSMGKGDKPKLHPLHIFLFWHLKNTKTPTTYLYFSKIFLGTNRNCTQCNWYSHLIHSFRYQYLYGKALPTPASTGCIGVAKYKSFTT